MACCVVVLGGASMGKLHDVKVSVVNLNSVVDAPTVKLCTLYHPVTSVKTHGTHSKHALVEDTYAHLADEAPTDAIGHSCVHGKGAEETICDTTCDTYI